MTSFILKIIGIITMLFDHIGDSILGEFSFLNLIGRIAFPLFAFQAVQGYIHTKDFKKHLIKMIVFACISQIPFMLFLSTFTDTFMFNIFFTFTLALIALYFYDKVKNKLLGFIIVLCITIIAEFIKVDYGAFGILLIFSFYFFKDKPILITISTFILCFGNYIIDIISYPSLSFIYILCAFFTFLPSILILFYNKKEGPKTKYFFYIFYPLHLLILYFIHMALYF